VDYDATALRQAFPGYDLHPGHYVRLTVTDTGHGMDPATQAQIFDPFFTTKFTGRGLGLAAALGIVRGHHGAIAVESAPGGGTTFTVVLPALVTRPAGRAGDAPAAGAPAGVAAGAGADRSRGTILVVDDEPLVREIAEALLVDFGYTVLAAGDGREAVELFRREAERVALILLDLTMPVLGGEEAIRLLHEIRPGVPVIVTSGYGETATLERFSGTAVRGFLPKPFNAEQLERAVGEALA
jgi:two-component system, cell cycle sensor histidine kinase and response regulator CckA